MELKEFQKYRRLALEGKVAPLTHSCGMEYAIRANANGENPYLECLSCKSKVMPGLNLYNRVLSQNQEFYV